MDIHWIATFLDPTLRELSFITNKTQRLKQFKTIENGLFAMSSELNMDDILVSQNLS
jgi:hypothetical protein